MEKKSYVEGLVMGTGAFILWGLLPLYWKLVKAISPYQIFAHRVVWSFLFVMIILGFKGLLPSYKVLISQKKNWINILGPAFFISINWLVLFLLTNYVPVLLKDIVHEQRFLISCFAKRRKLQYQ